jgi:UDP-N-acetylglucosamine 4,6-dehydratase
MFKNKILMITGGTGSFGNALLTRFLATDIQEIRIFSRDEKKQEEMRIKFNNPKLKFYIGDVRDFNSVFYAMKNVDYVFHAAALKQVPSCEFYPGEAIRTNVIGSENVMNAAISRSVSKVVMLSTDKAVYPINAMGLTKALMEKLMTSKARTQNDNETIFCATRYGNVMVSRGSVIPLFISQIKTGDPLTVTDPKMTRFLMSLEDSVELVLYAFKNAKQGDIFIKKSPAATINDIACALKILFNKDNPIKIIGTRHGEKLYESLISREEKARAEDMGEYYRIPADNRDLNYSAYFNEGEEEISHQEDYTSHNSHRLSLDEIKSLLLKLDYVKKELNA